MVRIVRTGEFTYLDARGAVQELPELLEGERPLSVLALRTASLEHGGERTILDGQPCQVRPGQRDGLPPGGPDRRELGEAVLEGIGAAVGVRVAAQPAPGMEQELGSISLLRYR